MRSILGGIFLASALLISGVLSVSAMAWTVLPPSPTAPLSFGATPLPKSIKLSWQSPIPPNTGIVNQSPVVAQLPSRPSASASTSTQSTSTLGLTTSRSGVSQSSAATTYPRGIIFSPAYTVDSYTLTWTPGGGKVTVPSSQLVYTATGLDPNYTYTFSLTALGSGGTSSAVITTATPLLPTSNIISGVKFYYQTHNLSCEETATSMALTHQGIYVSQNQILAKLGVDWTRPVFSGGRLVKWGDPDKAFVGNVNGLESNYTGYQANPKALIRVLNSYHANIIEWSEPGVTSKVIDYNEVYRQVLLGHPVVAWATWDWKYHTRHDYTSEDGNRVASINPYDDHVYVVIGVTPTKVLVNDPIRGQYWITRSQFQAGYSDFNYAIVLK